MSLVLAFRIPHTIDFLLFHGRTVFEKPDQLCCCFCFTGELKTLALLDRERIPVYSLIARATDGGGRFCHSSVLLLLEDVNDNPPVFSSNHYTACVYENTATKALLTRVQAVDPDVGKSIHQPSLSHIGTLLIGVGSRNFSCRTRSVSQVFTPELVCLLCRKNSTCSPPPPPPPFLR